MVTRIASTDRGSARSQRWRRLPSSGHQGRRLGETRWNGTPTRDTTHDDTDTFNTNKRSTNRSTTADDVVMIDDNLGYGYPSSVVVVVAAFAGCPASSADVDVPATSTSTSRPSVVKPVDHVGTTSVRWPLARRLRLRPTWYALVWNLQPRHRRGEGGSLNGCTTTATMPATDQRGLPFFPAILQFPFLRCPLEGMIVENTPIWTWCFFRGLPSCACVCVGVCA